MKKEMSVDDALDEVLASREFDEIPSVSRTLANEVVRLRRENVNLQRTNAGLQKTVDYFITGEKQ